MSFIVPKSNTSVCTTRLKATPQPAKGPGAQRCWRRGPRRTRLAAPGDAAGARRPRLVGSLREERSPPPTCQQALPSQAPESGVPFLCRHLQTPPGPRAVAFEATFHPRARYRNLHLSQLFVANVTGLTHARATKLSFHLPLGPESGRRPLLVPLRVTEKSPVGHVCPQRHGEHTSLPSTSAAAAKFHMHFHVPRELQPRPQGQPRLTSPRWAGITERESTPATASRHRGPSGPAVQTPGPGVRESALSPSEKIPTPVSLPQSRSPRSSVRLATPPRLHPRTPGTAGPGTPASA